MSHEEAEKRVEAIHSTQQPGSREWMIYMWYEEPFGSNDDTYIYEEVKP